MFDASVWLSPLAGPNPSGESLRNDVRFHDLEMMMQPRVEVVRDERNNPVSQVQIPVDWNAVLRLADGLREQGRDLRLMVIVVRALANTEGFGGLAKGLAVLARTLETYWSTLHPELRPGLPPREAALRRVNALQQLQATEDGLLGDLRATTFFAPRGVGPITGRDLERATLDTRTVLNESASGLNDAERAALTAAHDQLVIRVRTGCAAQAAQAASDLGALSADARAARAALGEVETVLAACLDGAGVTLPDLSRFLDRVVATLDRATAVPPPEAAASATNGAGHLDGAAGTAPVAGFAVPGTPATFPDRLGTREDVVRCLDLIIAFYDRTEPSSPIPHLARRIRRMVPMDFIELMEDLAPSGLKEFRLLAGVSDGKKAAQKE